MSDCRPVDAAIVPQSGKNKSGCDADLHRRGRWNLYRIGIFSGSKPSFVVRSVITRTPTVGNVNGLPPPAGCRDIRASDGGWTDGRRVGSPWSVQVSLSGGDLFSHSVARAVSSALGRFTSVFGMGTGGATPLEPPERRRGIMHHFAAVGKGMGRVFLENCQTAFGRWRLPAKGMAIPGDGAPGMAGANIPARTLAIKGLCYTCRQATVFVGRFRSDGTGFNEPFAQGPLAQLAEHRTFNPGVVGSIPTRPTTAIDWIGAR